MERKSQMYQCPLLRGGLQQAACGQRASPKLAERVSKPCTSQSRGGGKKSHDTFL